MTKVRAVLVAAVAACLVMGLAAGPAAAATKKATVKQLAVVNKRAKKAQKAAAAADAKAVAGQAAAAKVASDLGGVATRLTTAEGSIKTILDGVPAIVNGLTTLGDAVKNQIGPGLKTLATAVETQIAPGLQKVADFIGAQEYGALIGRIELPAAAGGTVNVTPTLVSPDVPDSGNAAFVTASSFPIDLTALPAAAGNAKIGLRGAIRSAEADGAATGDPAGYMGGNMTLTCLAGACADGTGASKAPGELVCTATTAPQSIPLPTTPPSTTSQRVVTIQEKVGLTDQSKPDKDSTDILGSDCQVKGGAVYALNATIATADIPTSATPGPKD